MSCLEVISVRLAERDDFEDVMQFCHSILIPVEDGSFATLKAYRSTGHGTDMCIHIHWNQTPCGQEKSVLGLQIAQGLKHFGIVSHTVWMDQTEILLGKDRQATR